MGSLDNLNLENGDLKEIISKENNIPISRNANNLSASLMRKKSDPVLVSKVRFRRAREFLINLQEVIFGTKLCVLFPAIPLAIAADCYNFGRVSVA